MQALIQKASNVFCTAYAPDPHFSHMNTIILCYTAFVITRASTVHQSGKNTPWFFSSWQSCLFPAVVESDFSSDCPSAADIYLTGDRKITSFSPPSFLIKRTWQVLLLLCQPGRSARKAFKWWQERLRTYYPRKGAKGWERYCKQDYTYGCKTAPFKWKKNL